ncbi:MAG: hypothetical protein QXU40_00960 [Candidatus Pacearchaeota archaeon]
MRKNKVKIRYSVFYLVVSLFLSFLLLFVFLKFNFLLSPYDNMVTNSRVIIFRWIGFSESILVDDNPLFTSPLELSGRRVVISEFEPGVYFWKTSKGISGIRSFKIEPEIVIEKNVSTNSTKIKNKGNVRVLLEMFNNLIPSGKIVLDRLEEIDISNKTEVIASQES